MAPPSEVRPVSLGGAGDTEGSGYGEDGRILDPRSLDLNSTVLPSTSREL